MQIIKKNLPYKKCPSYRNLKNLKEPKILLYRMSLDNRLGFLERVVHNKHCGF